MKKNKKTSVSSYILNTYIFIVFCIYPLYVDDGYYNIGMAKIEFYYTISFLTLFSLLIFKIIELIRKKQKLQIPYYWNNLSTTEKLLYLYMLLILLSYLASPFKKDVLWGCDGWYMGTIPLLMMCNLVIFLIHNWKEQKWIGYGCLIITGFVFILGICHRFSFYPIRIEPSNNSVFISTIGNINWFCGFMSVLSPIGIGMFVLDDSEKSKNKWTRYLLIFYTMITFIVGFCQGSTSYFLWIIALFIILLWIAASNTNRLKNYLLIISIWGFSGQVVRIINYLLPGKYNYDMDIFNSTIDTNITLIIAVISIILSLLIKEKKEITVKCQKFIRISLVGLVFIAILVYAILTIYNTKIGIAFLKNNSYFLWNEYWGNGRGIIYKESISLFDKMNVIQKLIGVGADGFYVFAYSFPENVIKFNNEYGNLSLTNAHCEILTNLINLGILGTLTYIGILLNSFIHCMKQGEQKPMSYICALCIICYLSNNLVSFAQVLNMPFLFVLIGLNEYYIKKTK